VKVSDFQGSKDEDPWPPKSPVFGKAIFSFEEPAQKKNIFTGLVSSFEKCPSSLQDITHCTGDLPRSVFPPPPSFLTPERNMKTNSSCSQPLVFFTERLTHRWFVSIVEGGDWLHRDRETWIDVFVFKTVTSQTSVYPCRLLPVSPLPSVGPVCTSPSG